MQLQNSSASSQLLPSLNFDDDNELQNLAGIGDVCDDLPDVFWDYGDGSNDVNVSSMDYAEVNAIPTTAPAAGTIHPQPSTTVTAKNKQPTEKNDLPVPAFPPTNLTSSQSHQQQQQSLRILPNVNIDLNTLPNYVTASYAQLAGNLGGYPPFLMPSATASLESGSGGGGSFTPTLPNTLLPQPQRGNGNLGQQPQLQHPQLGGTVNILQHVNNSLPNTTASGTSTTTSTALSNTQQSDQTSAQALHNQIFGMSSQAAGLNPQLVYQSIQQQSNDQQQHQMANLQLLQQQIQGNSQNHLLPSQLFRTNGMNIPSGGGDQGRVVSSQELQPQSQAGVSPPPPPPSQQQHPQVQVKGDTQTQSNTTNAITKQKPVYHSQAGSPLLKGGQQHKPGSAHTVSQPPSIPKPKTSKIPTQLSSSSKPHQQCDVEKNIPAPTTETPPTQVTKTNIVSSSDTDGEHQGSVTRALTSVKKNRRLFPHDSSSDINKNQRDTSSPLLSIPSVYSQQNVKQKNMNIPSSDDTSDCSKKNSSIEIKHSEEHMTEKERADANRKRNREHARNTRARKKAYLESLKSSLDELCRERDSLVSQRAGNACRMLEDQKTRTDVLLTLFALISSYELRRSLWSSILDESVNCHMPITPYRSFPASEVQISKCQRTIMGVDGMIADAASIHVLFHSLVDRSQFPDGKIQFRYKLIAEEAVVSTSITEESIVSGNQMMTRWSMATTNATKLGAKKEVKIMGMLNARFNSAHKIVYLELMFDAMAFMLQLKQSVGANVCPVIPNTVQSCIGPFGKAPMVITLAERPFVIVQVNAHWEEMTGWKAEDVVGKESCKILQGENTEKVAIDDLMSGIRYQRPAFSILTNYSRDKKKLFRNFLCLYPLSTDSKITHFLGLTVHVEWLEYDDKNVSKHSSSRNKTERNENKMAFLSDNVMGSSFVQPGSLGK